MRSLSRIECFTAGCSNDASVTINGDHVCIKCARADLPTDMHKFLPAVQPQANQMCGCGQVAADDIRYGGMCASCYQIDCEAEHAAQVHVVDNADLIKALRASMQIAVSCSTISDEQAKLVADHIAELEAEQLGYIPF